jgi:hypothetical protein
MSYEGTVTIGLTDLVYGTFQVVTHGHLKTQEHEIRRTIWGLSRLSGAEIRSLPNPPTDGPNWELRVDLEWEYLHKLLEASRISKLDISTIFQKLFYAFITERALLVEGEDDCSTARIEVTPWAKTTH